MTGPEHYREAERLMEEARHNAKAAVPTDEWHMVTVASAQVHATLALAAATAYPAIVAYTGDETSFESRGWANVTAPTAKQERHDEDDEPEPFDMSGATRGVER